MAKGKRKISNDESLVVASTAQVANGKPTTHHPHDKFVKCALKNKAIAVDFFEA